MFSNCENTCYFVAKRLLDILLSLGFIVIFSWLFVMVALIILLQDLNTPIYIQKRVGKGRKLFDFIKFRSMIKSADAVLFSDPKLYNEIRSGGHKIKNDPRVTPFGRFIRKYSIDEFPQVFNVLRGEMSFVGPRALRPDELKKFETEHPEMIKYVDTVFLAKPGITGVWQVSGRNNIDFTDRMKMDAKYAEEKSLKTDFLVLFKTPLAVIKGEGAS